MEASSALAHQPEHNGSKALSEPSATRAPEGGVLPLELPRARRPSPEALVGLAAAAGLGAIALGVLALVLGLRSDDGRPALAVDARQAIALLSKPSTERIPFERSAGTVVLAAGSGARGVLVLSGLRPAAAGKAYQAWVVAPMSPGPLPAAVFSGEEKVVPLTRPVPPGSTVAITVEDAVGVDTPTQRLRLVARRA